MTHDDLQDTRDAQDSQDSQDAAPEKQGKPTAEPPTSAAETVTGPEAEDPAEAFAAGTANAERLSGAGAASAAPDYKDRWLRAEAEIQNARRRMARDRDDAVRASEERILIDMVEVLDDLERALAALPQEQAGNAWAQGVALTAQRLRDALARRGVTAIATVGEPFDPMFHDALLEVAPPAGTKPGAVVQEVQKGYARDNRALRAARVVVAKSDR
jgi:molecular chaperone GrpE